MTTRPGSGVIRFRASWLSFYPERGLNWEQNWEHAHFRYLVRRSLKTQNPRLTPGILRFSLGAGEETRTLDLLHGKQSL